MQFTAYFPKLSVKNWTLELNVLTVLRFERYPSICHELLYLLGGFLSHQPPDVQGGWGEINVTLPQILFVSMSRALKIGFILWPWKLRQGFHVSTVSPHHLTNFVFFNFWHTCNTLFIFHLCWAKLVPFHIDLSFWINSPPIYVIFWLSGKILISKMADPKWRNNEVLQLNLTPWLTKNLLL